MRLFAILLFSAFAFNAHAASLCNFDKMQFGTSIEQVISYYGLEVMEPQTEGEFLITEVGSVVCNDLPETSLIEFMFIDDTFVKANIQGPDESAKILDYANETFGPSDDADRKKAVGDKTLLALWAKNSRQSVVYSATKNARNEPHESLAITSKLHSKLFEKLSIQRGKAMDAYLKANKLGKYSDDYKGMTTSGAKAKSRAKGSRSLSGGASEGEANSVQDDGSNIDRLKRRYERSQDMLKKEE